MPNLVDAVIDQIMFDVKNEDLTAIEEFLLIALHYVPEKYLIEYLPEEKQNA
jgi:hypothetical protein